MTYGSFEQYYTEARRNGVIFMEYDLDSRKVKWNNDFHREVSGISVIEYFKNQEAQPPSDVPLEPIYIRLSDAEINYKSQFGQS